MPNPKERNIESPSSSIPGGLKKVIREGPLISSRRTRNREELLTRLLPSFESLLYLIEIILILIVKRSE
jgi:hypothetical protein